MTGAEAITYREGLGISQEWLAATANRRSREVEKWENDRIPVPEDVAELLYDIDDNYEGTAMLTFGMFCHDDEDDEDIEVKNDENETSRDKDDDDDDDSDNNDDNDDDKDDDHDADDDETPEILHALRYRTDADLHTNDIPELQIFTASMHNARLFRVLSEMRSVGIDTIVSYFEPDTYNNWLDGRPDSLSERSEWAGIAADKPTQTTTVRQIKP